MSTSDDIALDQGGAEQTYTQTQGELRDHRGQIPDHDETGIHDPAISAALHGHNSKTKAGIDDSDGSLDHGRQAAKGLADTDRESSRTRLGGPGGLADLRNALAGGPGAANPFAGATSPASAPAAPPAMPTPAEPTQTPTSFAAPPMVNLEPEALAKLLAGAQGASPEAANIGGPAGGHQPLSESQVAFRPTGQTLTRAQMMGVIEKALDNNGVSTDPQVRARWREILYNQGMKESSGVPDAVNRYDSNAHQGGPARSDGSPSQASRGMWQEIPGTFAAHHIGGTSNNIYDPEANASAAVAYMMSQYQVSPSGAGLEAFHARRAAAGYGGY